MIMSINMIYSGPLDLEMAVVKFYFFLLLVLVYINISMLPPICNVIIFSNQAIRLSTKTNGPNGKGYGRDVQCKICFTSREKK